MVRLPVVTGPGTHGAQRRYPEGRVRIHGKGLNRECQGSSQRHWQEKGTPLVAKVGGQVSQASSCGCRAHQRHSIKNAKALPLEPGLPGRGASQQWVQEWLRRGESKGAISAGDPRDLAVLLTQPCLCPAAPHSRLTVVPSCPPRFSLPGLPSACHPLLGKNDVRLHAAFPFAISAINRFGDSEVSTLWAPLGKAHSPCRWLSVGKVNFLKNRAFPSLS